MLSKCNKVVEIPYYQSYGIVCQYTTFVTLEECQKFCTEAGGQIAASAIRDKWDDIM